MTETSDQNWIADARKKAAQFNSFTDYLIIALDKLEKSNARNAELVEAFACLKNDMLKAPEKVIYDRDAFIEWIDQFLPSHEMPELKG